MKTTHQNSWLLLLTASATLALTACGGGGSGGNNSTTPVAQTCQNGGTDYPACTEPFAVVPAKLQEAKAAAYASSSNELVFFAELNAMRTAMGLGPLHQSALLDASTANHATYLNASFVPGDNFHVETLGRTGYTGTHVVDRVRYAGYPALYATETGSPDVGKQAFAILADTVYHRQAMMEEENTHVGMISTVTNGTITNYAYIEPQSNSTNFVGVYPVDGQVEIPLNHYLETPNPFPELEMTLENMCAKTGFPISLQSSAKTNLEVKNFTLQEVGQPSTLPVRLLTSSTIGGVRLNTAFIVAHAGLKPLTQYEVKFVGVARPLGRSSSLNIDKTWRFTTASRSLLNGCP